MLQALPHSFQMIRERVRPYTQEHYDYTIIDCPPNMGFFVVSALYAANFVIVPIKSGSTFSLQGLMKAIDLINEETHIDAVHFVVKVALQRLDIHLWVSGVHGLRAELGMRLITLESLMTACHTMLISLLCTLVETYDGSSHVHVFCIDFTEGYKLI